jgi:hypothetical protein
MKLGFSWLATAPAKVLIQLDGKLAIPLTRARELFRAPRFGVFAGEAVRRLRIVGLDSGLSEYPLEWKHVCAAHFD